MIATLTAYDNDHSVVYQGTRQYPDPFLLWDEVRFSTWTPERHFAPSRRFHDLLRSWGGQFS
jgi:hypothetical protein